MTSDSPVYLGLDVGTGSARIGAFTVDGELLASAAEPIRSFAPRPGFAQQSSVDVWASICRASAALQMSGLDPSRIAGIGVDATCSLVAVGPGGAPVSVSPDGAPDQDIVLWYDHRATAEAEEITATGNAVLDAVGGRISPEMQMPKLLWLSRHLPESFAAAEHFFDLPDWLVHRATDSVTRSLCSATCKWTYRAGLGTRGEGWDLDFLSQIGLASLARDGCKRIGTEFAAPGAPIGRGLSETAAAELGLPVGTPVATSLIDAYSGALGTLGVSDGETTDAAGRLALIAGTSACHIVSDDSALFVPGVWGPYFGVLFPSKWANEAGQSAAGALLDRVLAGHAATADLQKVAEARGVSIHDLLSETLSELSGGSDTSHLLTETLHIQPDFLGNRAPLADPLRLGAISGLAMDCGAEELARHYLAAIQGLAYGTRQIIEAMRARGAEIHTLVVSGGLARNPLYLREHSDATGCTILVPKQEEPVLLGSAMLGAIAAGAFDDMDAAGRAMCGPADRIARRGGAVTQYHDAKYRVFLRMQDDFAAYRALMNERED